MNICEYLGLKPNREFKINNEFYKYRFSEIDRLEYYNSSFGEWRFCNDIEVLSKILHDKDLIEVIESKVNIGLSYHDIVILNGLVRMNKSKIVMIFRSLECEDGRIRFMFENGKNLILLYYDVKLNFLLDFDYEKFEVKCEDDGCVKVWGIRE